ncbi:hypothetical protein GCM10027343_04320 [Noviherbaspirillum agri]
MRLFGRFLAGFLPRFGNHDLLLPPVQPFFQPVYPLLQAIDFAEEHEVNDRSDEKEKKEHGSDVVPA